MTDTYNDTTGSRKKFLIPLVVLLLCAVSLTGAGYAYNASVSLDDNTAPIDEVFTIDLYSAADGTVITAPITAAAVNGLVFTADRSIIKDGQTVTTTYSGDFELEAMKVVIQANENVKYTGIFAITADNLARGDTGNGTTTTTATVAADKASGETNFVKFVNGNTYSVANNATITSEVQFFSDAACTQQINDLATFSVSNTGSPVTYYYYQIVITAVTGATVGNGTADSAIDYAQDVVEDIKLEFNIKLTATANES